MLKDKKTRKKKNEDLKTMRNRSKKEGELNSY
jgi:hypothetical protein